MFNLKIEANLAKLVCMNTYNSETISARSIKSGDNISCCSRQLKYMISFCHAPLRPRKLKKCCLLIHFPLENEDRTYLFLFKNNYGQSTV